ncbi:MAG: GNAT family N-acetyltransferase [Acidobacteria bacterium]|nr:GNAT family N-acetyltransferase [Acidobacteriota bacterium]MCA1637496.1 GNAT family N-acetyltransferase [Acidobacteriota bacterium]
MSFRKIEREDFEFLWRLHNAALKDYVMRVWGWDEERQRQLFRESFETKRAKIIVFEGKDAGFLDAAERETETVLISIRLLPEFQNKGIGTKIIQEILEKSHAKNKLVRLQVLKINPAKKLYNRLGFKIFGETETHFLMRK